MPDLDIADQEFEDFLQEAAMIQGDAIEEEEDEEFDKFLKNASQIKATKIENNDDDVNEDFVCPHCKQEGTHRKSVDNRGIDTWGCYYCGGEFIPRRKPTSCPDCDSDQVHCWDPEPLEDDASWNCQNYDSCGGTFTWLEWDQKRRGVLPGTGPSRNQAVQAAPQGPQPPAPAPTQPAQQAAPAAPAQQTQAAPTAPASQAQGVNIGGIQLVVDSDFGDLPDFNPRLGKKEGSHRKAYLRKQVEVECMVYAHSDFKTPKKIASFLVLNKEDRITVSIEDIAKQEITRSSQDPSKKGPAMTSFPVRFGLRRGWFWYTGNVNLQDLFIE